jgi:hypothetical protein
MARLRLLLALLVILWGAPALAQEGDAGSGGGDSSTEQSNEDGAIGGEEGADDATTDDAATDSADDDATTADDEGEVGAVGEEGAADGEVAGGGAAADFDPWTFGAFDADSDGFLTQDEFGSGLFRFVAGEEEGLGADQFEQTAEVFGLDTAEVSFETADVDQDGLVTGDQEFTPGIADQLFTDWDVDGDTMLSNQEFSSNMFATFDANADGTVDAQEFEPVAGWFDTGFEEVAGGGAGGFNEDFFLGGDMEPGVDATEEQDIGGEGDETDGAAGEGTDATDDDTTDDGMGTEDAAGDGADGSETEGTDDQ